MIKNDTQPVFAMARAGGSRGSSLRARDDTATGSMGGSARTESPASAQHGHNEIEARTEGVAGRAATERFAAGPDGNYKFAAPMPANELGRDIDPVRTGATATQTGREKTGANPEGQATRGDMEPTIPATVDPSVNASIEGVRE